MKTICKKFNTALGIALLTFSYSYNVLAAPGTLVQSPLFLSNSVEPNIFLTLDDSGSMGWGLMVSSEDAERITNGRAGSGKPRIGGRYRAIYNPDWYWWGHILPPSAGQNNTWAQDIWMMRNHNFNKLYYNPATIYSPWPGVDENNQPLYKDASITKASRHPNQNWAHTDLTTKKDYNGGNGLLEIYLPTYYIWNDDGDGVPENGEEQLVEIQANDAEMANFANWYVYYRTRELSAKAAIGGVVNNAGTARMGLDIFNQGHQVDVRTMTDASNKLALLEAVYDIPAMGGTPARESLKRVGKYFKEAGKNAPILKDGGECQQNFNILMTDGFWNGSSPKLGNADNDNDTNYDGGSYADGSGDTLADVAMWFYEHDLRPDIDNNVPTIPGVDEASHQHLVNYTIAFGLKGTLDPDTKDPTSAGFAWPSPWKDNGAGKIDDLWHAAYNSRGKYLSADNPQELENALNAMIQDISVRTETATSAAVSASLLTAGSKVYLTEFISGNWEGTIDAYGLKEVNHVWTLVDTGLSAAEQLAMKNIDNRDILTYNSDKKEGVEFKWGNLTDDMEDDLNTGPDGKSDKQGKARLNYIRGDHDNEGAGTGDFRQRAILASGNTSRLGDMVHSSPVYVGAPGVDWPDEFPVSNPSEPYSEFVDREENRTSIIYAGANDGMLHGFDSETLEEVLAYIPSNLFSDEPDEGLHYLTQRDYAHRYYVDLTPSVSDVFINGKWHTVLVGGQRAGGKGYFALDVTDPDNFDKDDVLWEFTDPDLGYTYSHPQIGMMNDGTWVAIFGNGYNNEGSGKAELFIVDIATGKKIKQISTEVGGTGSDRNGLATPALADLDLNGTIDRAYAGDLEGNMWAFDLSGDASAWKLDYKLFATEGAQPITTKPTLSFHPTVRTTVAPSKDANEPNIMVYFGSGQYLVDSDLTINTNTPADYFYGVWDNGKVALDSELVEQTISTADYKGVEFRFMSNNSVDYAKNTPDKGWKIKLPDLGERHITNPIVRGNVVYFNTSVPNSESCSGGGYGYRMAVDLGTGGSPKDPAIDIDQDGIVTKHDKTGTGEIPSGGKLAKLPSDPTMTEGKVIQDGAILDLQDLPDIKTGRFSWQELLR